MTTELRFLNLGKGHVICANNIWAVIRPKSAQNTRILREAKADGRFIDWTSHKPLRSIIMLDNGKVIGCQYSVATVYQRLIKLVQFDTMNEMAQEAQLEEEEEEDEDYED